MKAAMPSSHSDWLGCLPISLALHRYPDPKIADPHLRPLLFFIAAEIVDSFFVDMLDERSMSASTAYRFLDQRWDSLPDNDFIWSH